MYRFRINELTLKKENGVQKISPQKINVIIGPNNSGKSRLLKEIRDYLSGDTRDIKIVEEMDYKYPVDFMSLNESYDVESKMMTDIYGNWVLRTYSNKSEQPWDANATFESYFTRNFHSIGEKWETFFDDIIKNKEENQFFQYLGPLFYRYLGTEERLTICKMQRNYGLDSSNTNFLSTFKFEKELLSELTKNVKKIFKKDIILDNQTLGDRLAFRVAENFDYITGPFGNDNDNMIKLFNEELLDEQGDGLKSYVSTFLSLRMQENDILLIDEPEAFLHPPLARQLGELIGEFNADKQVFIATHSVEILKGILSKHSDVNIIRITQPECGKNEISLVDEKILKTIMQRPLLRVSQVLEGLFCEKVVVTEAEADELAYQELLDKYILQSGLYFVHGQGKQTLPEIAELYQKIGIKYEVITDFDILRRRTEFNKFMNIMQLSEEEKQKYRSYIDELRDLIETDTVTEGLNDDEKEKTLSLQRDKVYHEKGIEYLKEGVLKQNIHQLLSEMKKQHLHILQTGELETLLLPFGVKYTHNKNKWVVDALEKIAELKPNDIEGEKVLHEFLVGIV